MKFSTEELNIFRQWFNSVSDTNPKYLEQRDKRLYEKVLRLMKASQQPVEADANKPEPREYTAMMMDSGVVLCDKQEGAFLLLRYASDLERLKKLLNEITIVE